MLSEIGSNFWLNPHTSLPVRSLGSPSLFKCDVDDYVWLSTGRSAIRLVLMNIEERSAKLNKVAVLPSFTCDTVFEPFLKAGFEVFYYPIGNNLRTTSNTILETVLEHDASVVLFHRYFGFDTLDGEIDGMCEILRELGKYTIEDCTQCLYSEIARSKSDFIVGSIRKWTGTPDGGFAVCRKGQFHHKPIKTDTVLEQAKVKASYSKYRFLFEHEGEKSNMLAKYREAEDILDNQTELFAISEMSAKVQASLDINELVRKRRDNYNTLFQSLHCPIKPVFKLEDDAVPLYFPVLVNDRTSLQKHLVENEIYAPVVWPKDELQPAQCEGAENAYQHLLCIPIDQRYDFDDMNRIVSVINNYYNE